jgi:uncharacterized protein YdeI (YjbR/CyaY-like superfamily)
VTGAKGYGKEAKPVEIKNLITCANLNEWHDWLDHHHASEQQVWLVFYKGLDHLRTLSYDDALDEALCYGWIDSLIQRIDDERYARLFTRRVNAKQWSKINRERVRRLARDGRMTQAGLAVGDL